MRWSANFTPELEKQNCTVHYNVDQFGKENVTVEVKDGKKTIEKPWQQYLKDHVDEKLHASATVSSSKGGELLTFTASCGWISTRSRWKGSTRTC